MRHLHQMDSKRFAVGVCLLTCVVMSGGCGSYQLTGIVIAGEKSEALVLPTNDTRLHAPGIEGATVELAIDPSSMRPRPIPAVVTDSYGRFQIPVEALGAGVLEYELAVCCRAKGYETVYQTIQLPRRGRDVLISMVVGRDTYRPKTDILEETQQLADELLKK